MSSDPSAADDLPRNQTSGAPRHTWLWTSLAWLLALGVVVMSTMVWLGLYSAREANRQNILTALDTAVAGINGLAQVVELSAQSAERVVGSVGAASPGVLRTALGTALVAFRQVPELSHMGIILPEAAGYGNLERAGDGTIRMWLYRAGDAPVQTLLLTAGGFVEEASPPATPQRVAPPALDPATLQDSPDGLWNLRQHPWMVHDAPGDTPWGVSYTKALHDDQGHVLGVLDANFDLSQVYAYVNALRTTYGIKLDMIVRAAVPVLITDGTRAPQPVPEALASLLDFFGDAFADVMQIDGERQWVAARSVTFHGGVSVLFVAARPVSLFADVSSGIHWQMALLAVLILAVAALAIRALARYLGRTASGATDADLHYLATHDALTGLPNQDLIRARLAEAITLARASRAHVALLYLDLERFQVVNDNHGYLFGNAVLRAVGETIGTLVRQKDTVAHFAADQFLILLAETHDTEDVERLAARVTEALKHKVEVEGQAVSLVVNIGASLYPEHGDNYDTLVHNAQLAMRHAKEHDAMQMFTPDMAQESRARTNLEADLRHALADGQFHLVYQPKVSLKSGKIIGCEALLRWTHPQQGAIAPARFIPVAEESGLILPIGDWVLEAACTQARTWLNLGMTPVRVAVNLSAGQFFRRDVVAWVTDTLERTQLPAHCLQLELTESLHPQDMDSTIATFTRLQSLGVALALDDFGTGYSNLSHLKRFPIQTLKIDQSFVRHAMSSPEDAAIIRTVIALAHRLNFSVLAEGVETEDQLNFLKEEQCDEIQGFYFSRPLSPAAYVAKLLGG